ncbi:MAG TPA: peptidase M14, partial [Thiotrichales bacterium]|nr:peptidase M14 [Thiotrichales bacterium]
MLRVLDELPEGLLEAGPEDLLKLFGGPALLHLDGQRPRPLFVSVLLHGNEDTGFFAVRALLEKYRDRPPPRALSIFFGNVEAAARGLRRLEGQPDYNRVWPGADTRGTPEHAMMQAICDDLAAREVFAAIDVHNNTGINPHYACVNRLEHRFLRLAALFSRTVVYFTRPRGVASLAFSRLCPAVTVECGKAGQAHGIEHARDYLDTCLHLEEIPVAAVPGHDIDLYHTVVTVKVPEGLSFGFGAGGGVDIDFLPDLDHLNFRELPP